MSAARNLDAIFDGDHRLNRLTARARALLQIERQVRRQLPAEMAPHCRLVNANARLLLLSADSPAWATRLRYEVPRLQQQLRETTNLTSLQEIRVVVRPMAQETTVSRRARPLSASAADSLQAAAESVEDEALSAALARLARHRR